MALFGSFKTVVVERAMRFMSDPRLTKFASSPQVMSAAMKALSLGSSAKSEISKVTRMAAALFGIATEEEISALRSTIQTLEDTVAMLEARSPTAGPTTGSTRADRTAPAG